MIRSAVAEEREACARIADEYAQNWVADKAYEQALGVARAIRARSAERKQVMDPESAERRPVMDPQIQKEKLRLTALIDTERKQRRLDIARIVMALRDRFDTDTVSAAERLLNEEAPERVTHG